MHVMVRAAVFALLGMTGLALSSADAIACEGGAFVTAVQGDIANVEWTTRRNGVVKSHAIVNQITTIEGAVDVRPDQTAFAMEQSTSTRVGSPARRRPGKALPPGSVLWWDYWPSTLQQVTLRAFAMRRAHAVVPLTLAANWQRANAIVDRRDATTWMVRLGPKRYDVLTDGAGCVLTATMPDYGVTIEHRATFSPREYPLWPLFQAPPDGAYEAREVRIPAPAGYTLAGTLTLPHHRSKPLAAAIMITGISPHDRDEGPGTLRVFRDLADELTRAGIAVLRVDDRGVGQSTGDRAPMTTLDEAADVRLELDWLTHRADIDPRRIALVGHSEGGLIAAIVASQDSRVAAIVTLAGPGFRGSDIYEYQTRIDVERNPLVPVWDRERRIRATLAEPLETPRDRWFVASDPIPYARRVRVPALLIHGGNDLHVPPASAERLAQAMRSGGNHDTTVVIFPNMSHTLLPDADGTAEGWAFLPEFLVPRNLRETVRDWLLALPRRGTGSYRPVHRAAVRT